MRGAVRVRPVARLRGLHPRSVSRAAFIPATSPSSFRQFVSHGMSRLLEPFTPCWVSHRNLLKPRFHPQGTNHRRDNPERIRYVQVYFLMHFANCCYYIRNIYYDILEHDDIAGFFF